MATKKKEIILDNFILNIASYSIVKAHLSVLQIKSNIKLLQKIRKDKKENYYKRNY